MSKKLDTLYVELSVEDVQPVVIEALGMNKNKLIEWRSLMAVHGYQNRVEEIQEWIDVLVKAEKGE